ncbi:MAG: MFS transporter [Proteobacteria bacterium]|nr:MFS transporter [Pseudomonadota bacterium]MDA1325790.1 MFS transporter [Pseudomonadota bacterium]
MSAPAPSPPDRKSLRAAYFIGLFGMGYIDVFVFLMPLYGLKLGLSATDIGWLVGGRTILTLFFSIHIGVLMDRFGTLTVMRLFVLIAMFAAPLYPLLDTFWALLVLQTIVGGAVSFGWAGGQTLIAQIAHGDAGYIGRFSFASRIGTTGAPLIAGAIWDLGGVWPSYLLAVLWGAVLLMTLRYATEPPAEEAAESGDPITPFSLRDIVPRLSDYTRSFAMMGIPVIAISVAVMFLRNTTSGINNSVYVVYLDGVGLTGWDIGVLFAAIEFASGIGSLLGGPAMRLGHPLWTMTIATALAIALIGITPWLGGIFLLLLIAQILRGLVQGVSQPVMFSAQSKSVGRHEQGAVVGLRQTLNRLAAIIVPPVMGAVADHWDMEESFPIMGFGLLFLCGLVALWVAVTPLRPIE